MQSSAVMTAPAWAHTTAKTRAVVTLEEGLTYEQIYESHFDFVWRNARRLGVSDVSIDDVVQDVFIVAHRKLPCFEARSSIRTWLFGILLKVAKDHRRSEKRRLTREQVSVEISSIDGERPDTPEGALSRKQAASLLLELLQTLDEDKRAIFVLVELEQMSVADVAEMLGLNANTAHARLRAARQAFERALTRHRARMGGRR